MPQFTFTIFVIATICSIFWSTHCNAEEFPKPGNRYKIIKPVYLYAQYNDLNEKAINREKVTAYLHDKKYANKSTVAFQCQVPTGTIMTIVGRAPKIWHIPFFAKRYFITINPDLSRGLEIIMALNRGIEGKLDGLNPELFIRIE